jgi:hypothetical protein
MAIGLDAIVGVVQKGFGSLGAMATPAGLRDDAIVREAAQMMLELLPFPVRLAVKMSVGADGFERFVFGLRDRMLESGATDVSKLGAAQVRELVMKGLSSVPGLGKLVDPGAALAVPEPQKPAVSRSWYLLRGETRLGPMSDGDFLTYAEKGELQRSDQVWREGFAGWVPVADLPSLAAIRHSPAAGGR